MKDVVLEPQEILALYASPNQVEKGETVMLGDIQSQNQESAGGRQEDKIWHKN